MEELATINNDEAVVSYDVLLDAVKEAEARIEAVNRIKKAALKVTNQQDWIDQNGKPYLQSSGAEKIARLFNISWRLEEPIFEQEEDGHFSYSFKGYFTMKGITIEAIGVRSSKDGFFTKYKDGKPLPVSAIDKGDVKKAAFTNCIANGITRLLGIRNLTWEDIESVGIKRGAVTQVAYKKELTEMHKKLEEKLNEVCKTEEERAKLLKELTAFTDAKGIRHEGKEKLEQISEKMAQVAYGKLKQMMEAGNGNS